MTLRTANDLSIALRRMPAAHEEALELARQVYDLSRQLFGEKNQDTMAAAISLTNIQRTIGQIDEALDLAEARWTAIRIFMARIILTTTAVPETWLCCCG